MNNNNGSSKFPYFNFRGTHSTYIKLTLSQTYIKGLFVQQN